ncbi:MAG TPA: 1,2-phenylacetyl-CoA epoxidase subunit PaaC [Actinomycetota bacterium]|nr:1,2-phenylacetyl-CoA epoxidase subunit PaaC [Actinomycetota bacterium]
MASDADPRIALLLALADDELIIGHRHSEWTGWAPHIEEDLAFSSIAQDEMAHARLLFGLVGSISGEDVDHLALGRAPEEYRNAWLCERPNGDWGYSVARQYLYDTADDVRTASLADSSWKELADIINVVRLEERYHLDHARAWFRRLATGPSATARQRLADGLAAAIGEAVALFEPLPGEEQVVADGVLPAPSEQLLADWLERVGAELEDASLDFVLEHHTLTTGEMVPTSAGEIEGGEEPFVAPGAVREDGRWVHQGAFEGAGGRRGRHSDDFPALWEEMTALYRAHPGATW